MPETPWPQTALQLRHLLPQMQRDGLLSSGEVRQLVDRRRMLRSTQVHALEFIIRHLGHGEADADRLYNWLAQVCQLEYRRLDPMRIDAARVASLVSPDYARRHGILPIDIDEERVVIATTEPFLINWIGELSQLLQRRIERVLARPPDIERQMVEFRSVGTSLRQDDDGADPAAQLHNFEQLLQLKEPGAEDAPIVQLCDWLLHYAFEQHASDIHLEPRREQGRVRFRIDGLLHAVYTLPPPVHRALISRLKILSRMDVAEKRRPQDGRIRTRNPQGREIELRLSMMPTAFGEKCVARIFDPEVARRPLDALGFEPTQLATWQHLISQPHGIVLVTGPTGSGKTTTLYATLRQLARPELNVCTVEDPIELVSPDLNQMQVRPQIGLDFVHGIRTLLRQDPDIIMVGEIRDRDTAAMAVQAALTGHLVLSTLHTNDATASIVRLLDLGVPHFMLQATLLGVMAQRLVRTLCPYCSDVGETEKHLWPLLSSQATPDALPQAQGCTQCRQTGYSGRTGIYEVLRIDEAFRQAITPDANAETLRTQAQHRGMRSLREAACQLVQAQRSTISEVLRVLPVSAESPGVQAGDG